MEESEIPPVTEAAETEQDLQLQSQPELAQAQAQAQTQTATVTVTDDEATGDDSDNDDSYIGEVHVEVREPEPEPEPEHTTTPSVTVAPLSEPFPETVEPSPVAVTSTATDQLPDQFEPEENVPGDTTGEEEKTLQASAPPEEVSTENQPQQPQQPQQPPLEDQDEASWLLQQALDETSLVESDLMVGSDKEEEQNDNEDSPSHAAQEPQQEPLPVIEDDVAAKDTEKQDKAHGEVPPAPQQQDLSSLPTQGDTATTENRNIVEPTTADTDTPDNDANNNNASATTAFDELKLASLPSSDETKEEIEDPDVNKKKTDTTTTTTTAAAPGGGAYDFGVIENNPTQDTLLMVGSLSADVAEQEEEEIQVGQGDKQALLGSTTAKTPSQKLAQQQSSDDNDDDPDSIASETTEELNAKRKQERKCGTYICAIGLLGVVVALVLLIVGFLTGNSDDNGPPVSPPTFPVRPALPTRPPVLPPSATATSQSHSRPNSRPHNQPHSHPHHGHPHSPANIAPTSFLFPLPTVTAQAIDADSNSPQAQAYQWLLQDPNMSEYSQERAEQRFALATLYFATNGHSWISASATGKQANDNDSSNGRVPSFFLSYNTHECDWMMPALTRQETCNELDQYLILYLPNHNLEGTLPPEVPLLLSPSTLTTMDLNSNLLGGSIPSEMASLTRLETLDLGLNQLTGPALPIPLTACTSLVNLGVHGNPRLANTLPTQLGRLSRLQQLWIYETMLSGVIPVEIGQLSRLQGLFLQDNKLQGTLPVSLFGGTVSQVGRQESNETKSTTTSIMTLQEIHLANNQITGSIPSQIRLLRRSLRTLDLEANALTGDLPAELNQVASLQRLLLSHNPMLGGTIEGDYYTIDVANSDDLLRLDALANLEELTLTNTSVTGELPSAVCNITVLEFDCSESLCGCDCQCIPSSTSGPSIETGSPTIELPWDFTDTPTASPTLDTLTLPDYTLEALEDPETPQSKAFTWLQEDPSLQEFSAQRAQQRFALATLWYSTNSTPWANSTGWLEYGVHECAWFSDPMGLEALNLEDPCELDVTVDGDITEERQYIALLLPGNGLRGNMPPELALLSELRTIDLSGNLLTGFIPTSLGSLDKIEVLDVGHNFLGGQLPSELGTARSLLNILVWGNQLRGPIPSELGLLHETLLSLGFSNNRLNSSIPTELGALSKLQRLWILQNRLTGVLPSELGACRALQTLELAGNLLSGEIATQVSEMTSLKHLDLARNRIGGSLVSEIGLLGSTLNHLDVSANLLQGAIPAQIWLNLTSAIHINLSKNFFLGPLAGIGTVDQPLVHLFVSHNELTGPIPSEISQLTSLQSLDLSNNELSRSIPSLLGNLTELRHLKLNHNAIRGTIPPEFGALEELRHLLLHNSLLTGRVPATLDFVWVPYLCLSESEETKNIKPRQIASYPKPPKQV
ncbi:Leucine Rich Repeat [Seminavis robusta]|uniref:Leucine Rich Repeat n=1 Tax=Seminavis robusta TaxID=568900 RepID=A0A9N8D9E3_9STRA|nr:Leucine Rich Repeat [Seminavis robusta]|eukprot:Sro46_g027500.1 Leucine Rich Repeat (1430) ;mRNA; r:82058-86724